MAYIGCRLKGGLLRGESASPEVCGGPKKVVKQGVESSVLAVVLIVTVFSYWGKLQSRLQFCSNEISTRVKFYAQLFFSSRRFKWF